MGEPAADLAAGRNSPALHALVFGIVGLVLSPLLVPSIVALVWGAAGLRRAGGWARSGLPATGRAMAAGAMALGAVGVTAFVLRLPL
ncbi:hypothetical protein AB0F81_26835 [Actinoplanes sp. NPDC024001]|uniref:hypothetical protein n=1 Tax=Actinoplanes sp. NPDC024001 TaxID=3154598 RepID=UPI0033C3199E